MEIDSYISMNSQGKHQRHHSFSLPRNESKILSTGGRRSHGHPKSDSPFTSPEETLRPPASDGEVNLRHYFATLGLPLGCVPAILDVYNSMESRIWIVENSLQMMHEDSHLIRSIGNFDKIEKEDGVSRWSELQQCVNFHMKMAARCWIPTKFWFVNEPSNKRIPQRFGICWGDDKNWSTERENAFQIMEDATPEHTGNPLSAEIRKVANRLHPVASHLEGNNKFISVVISTQGVPTNENGEKGPLVLKEYLKSLVELASLPVKLVFRICSDDDAVLEFYNVVDTKVDSDVLDDFWAEALEVYLHNPWLNYGIGIHRIREAGLGTDLMDELDEKPFTLGQIRQWCTEFFVGKENFFIRHPTLDWNGFVEDVRTLLRREKQVFNPVKNKLCDWIDMHKLQNMHRRHTEKSQHFSSLRRSTSASTRNISSSQYKQQEHRMHHRKHQSFGASMPPVSHPKTSHSHVPVSVREPPTSAQTQKTSYYDESNRKGSSVSGNDQMDHHKVSAHDSRKHHDVASSMREQPVPRYDRRTTYHAGEAYSNVNHSLPRKSTSFHEYSSRTAAQGSYNSDMDLKQVIQKWSHRAPKQLRPLGSLLTSIPTLFPPINSLVEPHDYFLKWKEFSEDAFEGESGRDLNELLKRAVRKAKFFLHPDKLPNDLTENQVFVLKSVWDVVQEAEVALN